MNPEFVQLKWNAYQETFLANLSVLRDKQIYTDVTLSCGDQFYPAHRLVLASCSTFFSRSLEVVNCRSPVLMLHGIEQTTLEHLLMFMYDGQVTIRNTHLPNLLKAAQWLGIKGLDSTLNSDVQPESCPSSDEGNFQADPDSGLQLMTQILNTYSLKPSVNDEVPNPEDSEYQQVADKNTEERNPVDDMVVSHITSLSATSISFQPEEELQDSKSVFLDDESLERGDVWAESTSSPHSTASGSLLVPTVARPGSRQSSNGSFNFEGWEAVPRANSRWGEVPVANSPRSFLQLVENLENQEVNSSITSSITSDDDHCKETSETEKENIRGEFQASRKRRLCCKHCKEKFSVRVDLARHLRTHDNMCPYCKKGFHNITAFQRHIKLHEAQTVYTCSVCGFYSVSARGLRRHSVVHANDITPAAKETIVKVKEKNVVIACGYCDFISHSEKGMKRHIFYHRKQRMSPRPGQCSFFYKCHSCSFTSLTLKVLQRHGISHEPDSLFSSISSRKEKDSSHDDDNSDISDSVPQKSSRKTRRHRSASEELEKSPVLEDEDWDLDECPLHEVYTNIAELPEGQEEVSSSDSTTVKRRQTAGREDEDQTSSEKSDDSRTVLRSEASAAECINCNALFSSYKDLFDHKMEGCFKSRRVFQQRKRRGKEELL